MTLKADAAEPEAEFVETGEVELTLNVPNLSSDKARTIARDIRYTLENCAKLELCDEFIVALRIQYKIVPMKKEGD